MATRKISLQSYFEKLGLSDYATRVYIALQTHGEQTISDISRRSQVERTRVYRVLPELQQAGLLEESQEYARGLYRAAPLSNVQTLLSKREQDIAALAAYLPLVEQSISEMSSVSETRVRVYRGPEGVKQMLWNEIKAKSEILSIMPEVIQLRTRSKFFERWVAEANSNNLVFRSIVGESFSSSRANWYEKHVNSRLHNWRGRVIDDRDLAISHNTIIYDDIVGYFVWQDEIVGVEISSSLIANSQRQIFELLWKQIYDA